jgi:hypothetical protein
VVGDPDVFAAPMWNWPNAGPESADAMRSVMNRLIRLFLLSPMRTSASGQKR